MPDVFASSTSIFTAALGNLVTNYLVAITVLVGVSFGFFFLWMIIRKAKGAVKGK